MMKVMLKISNAKQILLKIRPNLSFFITPPTRFKSNAIKAHAIIIMLFNLFDVWSPVSGVMNLLTTKSTIQAPINIQKDGLLMVAILASG